MLVQKRLFTKSRTDEAVFYVSKLLNEKGVDLHVNKHKLYC